MAFLIPKEDFVEEWVGALVSENGAVFECKMRFSKERTPDQVSEAFISLAGEHFGISIMCEGDRPHPAERINIAVRRIKE